MGYTDYDSRSRSTRAFSSGYYTKSEKEIFTQSTEKKAHPDMIPNGIKFRECRDSEAHPFTVPIQFYLDVTGSMGMIPNEMIKDGLPTLMSTLIQNGVKDASLMFGGIGDHEYDRAPLQIGQFESGDAELDLWLTRTWLEKGGGGNAGESYLLGWYFASNHILTDAWEKRKTKGFVFTIGDEPCLKNLPLSAVKGIMGDTVVGQGNYTMEELLLQAQKTNHVFHIFIEHGNRIVNEAWEQMLGQNLIILRDHTLVSKTIADIVLANTELVSTIATTPAVTIPVNISPNDIIL